MRLKPKIDGNQTEVVTALRAIGCTVHSLAACGHGMPDLLVGYRGRTTLLEVKDGSLPPSKRALTPDQAAWHAEWRGDQVRVVTDRVGALACVSGVESRQGITIGAYRITAIGEGKVTIYHVSGEGMAIAAAEVEQAIGRLWRERF